jgi:hypothetical protein
VAEGFNAAKAFGTEKNNDHRDAWQYKSNQAKMMSNDSAGYTSSQKATERY